MRYQYCQFATTSDEMLKEEIKIIVNNVQETGQTHGWMGAMNAVRELSKKQYQDTCLHREWGPARAAQLVGLNHGRRR